MISRVLSEEQVEKIHRASLAVLERVGVAVPHPEVLGRFHDSGAAVDEKTQRVKIPPDLVMRLLKQAGKEFTIYGRDLSRKAGFGKGTRNYNASGGQASWVEEPGRERRYATLTDVATAARFCDGLERINIAGAMADPHEIPVHYRCVEVAAAMLENTTKPLTFWFYDRPSARHIVEMLILLRGSAEKAAEFPLCYPFLEPISPLSFPFHGIDLIFETARLNLPVPVGPMAQTGLSAPGTLAATMVQENAEILAGICITQLIRPGLPVCYGGICHVFDMATTQMVFGGPEQAIFGVGMTQLGKHYGLPVYINVGLTDAKSVDAQAGLEAGVTLALGAAAGADIFGHLGICGVDQGASLDLLVFQAEMISYVEHLLRDIDFSDEALGIDEIETVGPGGIYIDREFTAGRFRKELWFPKLLDRRYYQAWLESGARGAAENCRRRKEEILRSHAPEPLAPELKLGLAEIVAAAKKDLTG
ncbi:MAG TPA: trimethylamine methyltransferase family protein [bacterium]|nr:trimethylamine methyltransferase family protein [bacterium]HNS48981.1 trimethylamine methyltransferase family protein [bacterium]